MHHTVGNHCLSVPRSVLMERLKMKGPSYRIINLTHGWRLIILDTTEVPLTSLDTFHQMLLIIETYLQGGLGIDCNFSTCEGMPDGMD